MTAKVLFADVESAPIVAHVWGLRDLNVGINQIVADPYLMGVGYSKNAAPAKWIAEWDKGRGHMLTEARDLLDWADVVVGWNSASFDGKWLEGEFLREQIERPSPYKHLDLMRVVRQHFRFPSYKLQYVSKALGLPGKVETGGHGLWIGCMEGNAEDRERMGVYCCNDVDLLPPIFDRLRPYFPASINFALLNGVEELACPACASTHYQRRGVQLTQSRAYPRLQCQNCGKWFKEMKSVGGVKGASA